MIKKLLSLMVVLSLVAGIARGIEPADKITADLVIINAKIVTIDKDNPSGQAVAFKGEWIIGVTSNRDIEQYIEQGVTKVIDAQGRLVIPGFNDAHAHFGSINLDYVDLRYITDPATITQKVKEAVAKAKPGELISGGRWEHEMFYNKQWPTKELIDKVSPNNPVVLSRADGHSCLVNSFVLKNSGITKNTKDPFGGEIQKDPVTGEPTGIFKESAKGLLSYGAVRAERTPEEATKRRADSWEAAFYMAKSLGVTSVQMPPGGNHEFYQDLLDKGELAMRVYIGGRLTASEQQLKRYQEMQKKYPMSGNWVRFGYLKGMIDGTLGSGTALFHEPFTDEPDKSGLAQMTFEELEKRILASDKAGFQIGIHAIGD